MRVGCSRRLPILALALIGSLSFPALPARAQDIAAMTAERDRAVAAQDLVRAEQWGKRILDATIAHYGPDHSAAGEAYYNWGTLLFMLQRHAEAEKALRRAIAIRERTLGPNEALLGSVWGNLGMVLSPLGKHEESIAAHKKALSIKALTLPPVHVSVANSYNNLANAYLGAGRSEEAFPLWERAMEIFQQLEGPGSHNVGRMINNIGQTYFAEERFDDALPLLLRALAIYQKALHPKHPDIALTSNSLAMIYFRTGRYNEALPHYRRALDVWAHQGADNPDFARASALAAIREGDPAKANQAIQRVIAVHDKAFGPDSAALARTLLDLAAQASLLRQPKEAVALATRALAAFEKAYDPGDPQVARPLWVMVEAMIADGRGTEALPFARRASAILTAAVEQGRMGALAEGRSHSIQGAFSAVTQAAWVSAESQSSQRTALADEAFAAGQRLVASSAGAALSQMSVRFGTGNSAIARLIREQQDTTQKRRQLERVLNDERAKIPAERNSAQEKKLRADITEIDSKLTALANRLAKEAPQFSDLAAPKPLSFAEAQKLLGPDEALVFFMFDETTQQANSFVWALTRDGYAWGRLPIKGAEWSERVARFRAGLDVDMIAPKAALDEARKKRVLFDVAYAHQLYRELLGPVEDLIKDKRQLLVVPSGPLTALPFHLLVAEKPSVTPSFENLAAYREVEWLLKRHAVTVLPSVASLKVLRSVSGGGRATKVMVGFGDPVFASSETATTRKAARKKKPVAVTPSYSEYWKGAEIDRSKLALAQLPDTADELRAIAKRLGVPDGDIHLGRGASETTVKRLALADYRIVYFATHGLVAGDIKGVGEPSLALTLPAQASELDDGLLTASEVAQLKLNADWVVLSACNTIAGDKPGAEALSGLSRAFFYAGARALLVSHWAVDSAAATRLAIATFDKLAADAKLGRAEAVTLAMQDYLQDSSAAHYAYPAMWGAFSVVGDGRQ